MLAGLDAAPLPHDAIEVGRILDAWGVQGWFKVQPYSADPEALLSARRWYLLPPEKGQKPFESCVVAKVHQTKWHAQHLVARFQDVADRDAAQSLKGVRIFLPRTSFPSTADDEYYWVDLIGLSVVNREGQTLGVVSDLMSTGAQTVLVCEREADGKTCSVLIPFVSVYVDAVNLPERLIRVDWQPDY
ncbi:MAG: ribosome maturation factor RimM [Rhodoferax sp.]